MWSGGKDRNELGESVLLLQPVTSSKQKSKKSAHLPTSSHIGGLPHFYNEDLLLLDKISTTCSVCNESMHFLLQLNAPLDDLDRTLYVFACNCPSCYSSKEGKFWINSNRAPVRCFRSQQSQVAVSKPTKTTQVSTVLEDNDWGDDNDWGQSGSDDDDWGACGSAKSNTNDVSMDDLEAMISKCEMKSKEMNTKSKSNEKGQVSANTSNTSFTTQNVRTFKQYNLEMFDEPSNSRIDNVNSESLEEDEEDDDFGNSNNIDSSKVNKMLSSYLAMEDDEEILNALKNDGNEISGKGNADKGSGGGERYERLPPEERAFLAFSKRLRRAPLQVARYAYGGVPLWSIPYQIQNNAPKRSAHNKNNKQNQRHNTAISANVVPSVPSCICGAHRVFEFQLLPSMLHVLDVDSSASEVDESMDLNSIGGMNWGSIAVYSCPNSCDENREEICIVQNEDDMDEKKNEGIDGDSEEQNN